jgi:hypothetical protein
MKLIDKPCKQEAEDIAFGPVNIAKISVTLIDFIKVSSSKKSA